MRNRAEYKTKSGAIRGAYALLETLQERIDKDPSKFCENYGQEEINDFEFDRLGLLHYTDKCDVKDILTRVSNMTPNY